MLGVALSFSLVAPAPAYALDVVSIEGKQFSFFQEMLTPIESNVSRIEMYLKVIKDGISQAYLDRLAISNELNIISTQRLKDISAYLENIDKNLALVTNNQVTISSQLDEANGLLDSVYQQSNSSAVTLGKIYTFLSGDNFNYLFSDVDFIAGVMDNVTQKINSINSNIFNIYKLLSGGDLSSAWTDARINSLFDAIANITVTADTAWTKGDIRDFKNDLEELVDYFADNQPASIIESIYSQLKTISGQLDTIAALIVVQTVVDNLSSVLDSLSSAANAFTESVSKLFPFCIIGLIVGILKFAVADPVAPAFDIDLPLPTGDVSFSLSFDFLDAVVPILRAGELLLFVILLFANYRKYVISGEE